MRVSAPLAIVFGSLVVAGCTAILGYGDLDVRDDGVAGGGAFSGAGGSGAVGGVGGTVGGGGAGGSLASCGEDRVCAPTLEDATVVISLAAATCPLAWGDELSEVVDGADPGCSPCSCAAATGACTSAAVTRYQDVNCSNVMDSQAATAGVCENVDATPGTQARSYHVLLEPTDGSCSASTSNPVPVVQRLLCAPPAPSPGDCPEGFECVPTPPPEARLCALPGPGPTPACPVNYVELTVYDSYQDSRSCNCGCGGASGASCSGGQVTLTTGTTCTGTVLTTFATGSCEDVSAHTDHDSYLVSAGTYEQGTCQPQDNHSGGVSFGDAHIICCRP